MWWGSITATRKSRWFEGGFFYLTVVAKAERWNWKLLFSKFLKLFVVNARERGFKYFFPRHVVEDADIYAFKNSRKAIGKKRVWRKASNFNTSECTHWKRGGRRSQKPHPSSPSFLASPLSSSPQAQLIWMLEENGYGIHQILLGIIILFDIFWAHVQPLHWLRSNSETDWVLCAKYRFLSSPLLQFWEPAPLSVSLLFPRPN